MTRYTLLRVHRRKFSVLPIKGTRIVGTAKETVYMWLCFSLHFLEFR